MMLNNRHITNKTALFVKLQILTCSCLSSQLLYFTEREQKELNKFAGYYTMKQSKSHAEVNVFGGYWIEIGDSIFKLIRIYNECHLF